ncbi:FGGY-family carbohydrate kinase [Kineococcus gynurae]|uniref:FGGY-family carbohydrate kinase n=1 Tax=Kineococcus gynurae TaxID=452979 RepID=A0ABV5LPH2_9ACTN
MTRDLVVGLDCSTTATKAVVWDASGRALATGRAAFATTTPHPGWGEQNPEDWWSTTCEAVRRAVQAVDGRRVAALAITHQRETFACTTEDGRPLRPAMLWLDTRATEEVATFGTRAVHETTGKPPNPTPAWYKLLWLSRHEPATVRRTEMVADVGAYLVRRLTGRWATSWASADPLGVVDLRTFDYDDDLLQAAQLDRARLPELHPPGAVIGEVLTEVADALGLPRGLPVVAGAGDGQAAGLGTGVVQPGSSYLNLGSGIISGSASTTYRFSDAFRTMAGGVPGTYAVETFIGGGTHNISWFVERFAGVDTRALGLDLTAEQVLETAAAQLPPGSEGLLTLPYWTGALTPYWDHHARGTILGLTGRHGKSHVYRSLLEGLALEQRLLTDGAEAAVGVPVDRVVATGGGSRSPVWCQIMADVLQRPLHIAREPESTCLGAGVLAAAAVGLHDGVAEASEAMSGTRTVYEPDAGDSAVYDRLFGVYRRLYPQLRDVFGDLSAALDGDPETSGEPEPASATAPAGVRS